MVTRARFERATPSFGGCSGNPVTYRCCFAIRKTWFGPVVPGDAMKCHRVTQSRRAAQKLRKLTLYLDQLMQAGQGSSPFRRPRSCRRHRRRDDAAATRRRAAACPSAAGRGLSPRKESDRQNQGFGSQCTFREQHDGIQTEDSTPLLRDALRPGYWVSIPRLRTQARTPGTACRGFCPHATLDPLSTVHSPQNNFAIAPPSTTRVVPVM
jgi:hypothetical protein